ncbi:MAG TPA: hypothetical protein VKA68_05705 [bacterium]|nr:hypothetical protein [bacterium]
MTRQELKNLIHESIENIDDDEFLRLMKQILDRKYVPPEKVTISEDQINRIESAKKDIAVGKYLTNEEATQIIDKWLTR